MDFTYLYKENNMKIKIPKKRNPMAYELLTNKLYRPKVVKSKKQYDRKKLKQSIRKEISGCFNFVDYILCLILCIF